MWARLWARNLVNFVVKIYVGKMDKLILAHKKTLKKCGRAWARKTLTTGLDHRLKIRGTKGFQVYVVKKTRIAI
ncbi:MAG: hypothetical protein ACOX4L_09150 [Bacillota bacterium]|jgi:hypothetical protein